ncbi:MAG: hypothetical protein DI628_01830 [Blastochloris viridis]|uniref:Uncharacterized protein n=1 Tax=Blastochloris viridis TaxID=1079 RepID=A0A6N4R3N5_BLAVI|nr:MAG: hypothetical protein DI628_01830 [Blastochloris viridis]
MTWHFKKEAQEDTISESKLGEFFSASRCEAVVRESIQNSLDAAPKDKCAKIIFTFSQVDTGSFPDIYDDLKPHLKEVGKILPKYLDCLAIEDFGTTGLEGTIYKRGENKKSLVSFWWEEGRSKKRSGSGGSHGVGKSTLSGASQFNFFLALTRRNESPTELLLGYCILPPHSLPGEEEEPYLGYARFGVYEQKHKDDKDPPLIPYRDDSSNKGMIEKFRKHTGISRKDEHGVSIFIPGVHTDVINPAETAKYVIQNYFLPIVTGRLIVQINDTQINSTRIIDSSNINEVTEDIFGTEAKQILGLISLAKEIEPSRKSTHFYVPLHEFTKENRLKKESFSPENFELMQKEYASGKTVAIRSSISIRTKQKLTSGHFDIFLRNSEDKLSQYRAFRADILISNERCGSSAPFTAMILDVFDKENDSPLSEYLKFTEDPGHQEWKNSPTTRNNEVYPLGESWQKDFLKSFPSTLLSLLSGVEKQDAKTFADDIFYLDVTSEESTEKKKQTKSVQPDSGDTGPDIPPIPEGSPSLFSLNHVNGGFRIIGTKHLKEIMADGGSVTKRGRVKAAHIIPGMSKSRWFKSWISEDFDFSTSKNLSIEGVDVEKFTGNEIWFRVKDPEFEIHFTGFDPNRDVHIDVAPLKESEAA